MNIVLTGFMAAGKTETAKALEAISGYKMIDTDEMIVFSCGKSINEIFSEKGEKFFRGLEKEAVKQAAAMDNMIISTGGGVVLDKDNIAELRKNGVIINLAPDFDVIMERLTSADSTRPLIINQSPTEIEARYRSRIKYYADCDIRVEVTNEKTPADYAAEILKLISEKADQ